MLEFGLLQFGRGGKRGLNCLESLLIISVCAIFTGCLSCRRGGRRRAFAIKAALQLNRADLAQYKAYAMGLLAQRRRDEAFTVIRNGLTMVPAKFTDFLTQMALSLDNNARLNSQPGFVTNCRNGFKLEPDFS